ncbi:gp53-like domain-containing protein [Rhodococcus pyridinivorans]|uniref:gp53-like domain-containing protein n=1 Tax=Rhodococcus pyridinivorans TaxID=103816 RepID=UPI00128EFE63|nr:hypothetical protein [Rhodococcus pyridinivorans]
MAKQFTDQDLLPIADANDILPLRDISAGVDKKTTVAGLAKAVAANVPSGGLSANSVNTAAVQNGAIKPVKMDGVHIYARTPIAGAVGSPPSAQSGQFFIQTGTTVATRDGFGDGNANFNVAFPNGCFFVSANSNDAGAFNGSVSIANCTQTSFGFKSYPVASGAIRLSYIAIGW